jgi:hypothetical protein
VTLVVVTRTSLVRNVLSGYDFPLQRDWLVWVGLLAVVVVAVVEVRANGAWALLGAPIFFAFFGWVIGAGRTAVRGYRSGAATP